MHVGNPGLMVHQCGDVISRNASIALVGDRTALFDQFRRSYRMTSACDGASPLLLNPSTAQSDYRMPSSHSEDIATNISSRSESKENSTFIKDSDEFLYKKNTSGSLIARDRQLQAQQQVWQAWMDRKRAVELFFQDISVTVSRLQRVYEQDRMPRIDWDNVENAQSGGLAGTLVRQIAGMFAIAQRMISDLSNVNAIPFSTSNRLQSLFLRNVQMGLSARLTCCADGLRQLQDLNSSNDLWQSRQTQSLIPPAIRPQTEAAHGGVVSILSRPHRLHSSSSSSASVALSSASTTIDMTQSSSRDAFDLTENDPSNPFYNSEEQQCMLTESRMSSASTSAFLQQREQEIEHMADSVVQVAELLQSMHSCVVEQGTLLDRIDYNMEDTAVRVSETMGQVLKKRSKQKSSNTRLIVLVSLVLLNLFMLYLLVSKMRGTS